MTGGGEPASEFSRRLDLEAVRGPRVRFDVAASPTECVALAKRFGLVRLDRLAAAGEATLGAGGHWRLSGRLDAAVVQTCVVTLDPVPAEVRDDFEIEFAPAEGAEEEGEVEVMDGDAEPLPPGGVLDIGEIVAQQLSLALDPFPRTPGAVWSGPDEGAPAGEAEPDRAKPFEDLAARLGRWRET